MSNTTGLTFGLTSLPPEIVRGKRIIELGACDVNGGLRPTLEMFHPSEYVGVDIQEGPNVDIILDAEDVLDHYKPESFDIVIATELVEHTRHWRKVFSNMKRLCKPGGVIVVTTRSKGDGYHAHPHDYWRYEPEDMRAIFSDCTIERLENDPLSPGVFVKAVKPKSFRENDLSSIALYSIVREERAADVDDETLAAFHEQYVKKRKKYEHRVALYNRFRKLFG